MENSSKNVKKSGQTFGLHNKNAKPRSNQATGSKSKPTTKQWHRPSSTGTLYALHSDFAVKTSNKFSILENLGEKERHHGQFNHGASQKYDSYSRSTKISQKEFIQIASGLLGNHRSPTFFTVDSLDNQIEIFNLTKYAFPSFCEPSTHPLEIDRIPSSTARNSIRSSCVSSLANSFPCSYIPPHRRSTVGAPTDAANPKGIPGHHKSPKREDNSIFLFDEEIEDIWNDYQKVGIFAVWSGPKEDLLFLSNWLAEYCME